MSDLHQCLHTQSIKKVLLWRKFIQLMKLNSCSLFQLQSLFKGVKLVLPRNYHPHPKSWLRQNDRWKEQRQRDFLYCGDFGCCQSRCKELWSSRFVKWLVERVSPRQGVLPITVNSETVPTTLSRLPPIECFFFLWNYLQEFTAY